MVSVPTDAQGNTSQLQVVEGSPAVLHFCTSKSSSHPQVEFAETWEGPLGPSVEEAAFTSPLGTTSSKRWGRGAGGRQKPELQRQDSASSVLPLTRYLGIGTAATKLYTMQAFPRLV